MTSVIRVEAPADLAGPEAVAERGTELEAGVACERLGVDGDPGRALGGEDVVVVEAAQDIVVVEVPVQETVARLARHLAHRGGAVPDRAPVGRVRDPAQGVRYPFQDPRRDVPEPPHPLRRRHGRQPGQHPRDDEDGLARVGQTRRHAGVVEPFEQQRAGGRVMAEEAYGALAGPGARRARPARALLVQERELQHGRGVVGPAHRQHRRAHAVRRGAVEAQLPPVQEVRGAPRERGHEGAAGRCVAGVQRGGEGVRDVDHPGDPTREGAAAHAR